MSTRQTVYEDASLLIKTDGSGTVWIANKFDVDKSEVMVKESCGGLLIIPVTTDLITRGPLFTRR